MKRKTVNSQLYNYKTYLNYRDKMIMLALNVFQFKGLNEFIDMSMVNKHLLEAGSIAFFKDDEEQIIFTDTPGIHKPHNKR